MNNITNYNIEKGDTLMCLISASVHLTSGKEYIAESDISNDMVKVVNDEGWDTFYNKTRFIPKADLRNFNIEQIQKDNG